MQVDSLWREPVSMKAKRTGWGVEHFTGQSLVCVACQQPFRTFRPSAVLCSPCRSIGEAISAGQS